MSFPDSVPDRFPTPTKSSPSYSWRNPLPTVVLVDDDPSVRASISRVLADQNMNVLSASGGADALRLIQQHEPDLLITDLLMDLIDGWDLLACETAARPDLPIFVITALAARDSRGADKLATRFFQKPLDMDMLLTAIRHLFSGPGAGNGTQPI